MLLIRPCPDLLTTGVLTGINEIFNSTPFPTPYSLPILRDGFLENCRVLFYKHLSTAIQNHVQWRHSEMYVTVMADHIVSA